MGIGFVINQSLTAALAPPALKFTPAKELSAPLWEVKPSPLGVVSPWPHVISPTGWLLFRTSHPPAGDSSAGKSSNPSDNCAFAGSADKTKAMDIAHDSKPIFVMIDVKLLA
jgi:hypothetical protein